MYKVIDIGAEVPSTGEARVRILDEQPLAKTASSGIQDFWDGLTREEDCAYLWVIGVSAMEYYGCNNNGDAFTEADLRRTHTDFVEHAHVFMHHVNKDPAKSIGVPVYSWYNEEMHRVELVLKIRRDAPGAEDVLTRLRAGEQLYVSMGCTVRVDVCSICGNEAPTRQQYCDHLRYNMKKILPDGRQVFALNPDPHFFDISLVNRPADPTAFALDKIASEGGAEGVVSSAQLGERVQDLQDKTAALKKISDIIKEVEGTVAGHKETAAAKKLLEHGFADMEYPSFPPEELDSLGLSPAGFMSIMGSFGAPLSLGDAVWMACRHHYGDFCTPAIRNRVFDMLPQAFDILQHEPGMVDGLADDILNDYHNELDGGRQRTVIVTTMRPVISGRIMLVQRLNAGDADLTKEATDLYTDSIPATWLPYMNSSGRNLAPVEFEDGSVSTKYHVTQAAASSNPLRTLLGTALGTAAVSSLLLPKTLKNRLMYSALFGSLAVPVLMDSDTRFVRTADGVYVPESVAAIAWKQPMRKKAALLPKPTLAATIGMGTPAALALDYAYNKWRRNADPEYAMTENYGTYEQTRDRAGDFTLRNPATALLGGSVAGALLGRGLRGLRLPKKLPKAL